MTVQTVTHKRIAKIVGELLAARQISARPRPNDDLRQAGLTSLDVVKLVLSLEQEFGAVIPDKAITPANFSTIGDIEQLMSGLAGAPVETVA